MEGSEAPEYLIKTHLQLRLLTACSVFFPVRNVLFRRILSPAHALFRFRIRTRYH